MHMVMQSYSGDRMQLLSADTSSDDDSVEQPAQIDNIVPPGLANSRRPGLPGQGCRRGEPFLSYALLPCFCLMLLNAPPHISVSYRSTACQRGSHPSLLLLWVF